MTKEEALKVVRHMAYLSAHVVGNGVEAYEYIEQLLSQPSLPSDFDEAAEEWCKTNNKGIALSADRKSHYLAEGKDAFKAGAEWVAQQVETIDGEILTTSDYGWETIRIPKKLYPLGTEVTLQIRKKQ